MSNPSIPTSISKRIKPEYWLLFIVLAALAVAIFSFCSFHFFATRELDQMAAAPNGGLEWLRREYHLNNSQFQKIEALQTAYTPVCDEMCRRIMEANAKLDRLVSENKEVTPELQGAIADASVVQEDCRKHMLAHIYEVSLQMDPAEGQRYLRAMKSRVIQSGLASDTAVRATTE
jgi:hypothetical protein